MNFVKLEIRYGYHPPIDIVTWTPQETEVVLEAGLKIVNIIRNSDWKSQEIKAELKTEFEAEWLQKIGECEAKMKAEKECHEETQRRQQDMVTKWMDLYEEERAKAQQTKTAVAEEAMRMMQERFATAQAVLKEKEKHIDRMCEVMEEASKKLAASTKRGEVASVGKVGEMQFRALAEETFRDYAGFQIRDVHAVAGMGDFHMEFAEMSILVDAKLYSNKVTSTSRQKIQRDLETNAHMDFAWLISMETGIDMYDRAPFMFDWHKMRCVCYVNALMRQENPGEILRALWCACRAIKHLMSTEESERGMVSMMREKESKLRSIMMELDRNHKERDVLWRNLRENFKRADEMLMKMMNDETNVLGAWYGRVIEWWNRSIMDVVGGEGGADATIKSSELWNRFKREHEVQGEGEETSLDCETFKEVLVSVLGDRIERGKGGGFEVRGVKWLTLSKKRGRSG